MIEKFDEVGAVMLGVAQGVLEAGQTVLPMAFLIAQDGSWSVFGMAFKDEISKVVMYRHLAETAKKMNAAAAFLINDTWIRFDDVPGRHEALYAQLVLPDGSVMQSTTIPYVRKPGGQIEWGPDCTTTSTELAQNLLPPWGDIPTAS